ncbi:hypothetical protein PUN28_007278 [Cardiocondyla obscurior]|uniref:Uncharacterized protein n=1 Tax=Cardiocondyla obscurior TaxID=286306 RepID=A0AAW2G4R2_9HYME
MSRTTRTRSEVIPRAAREPLSRNARPRRLRAASTYASSLKAGARERVEIARAVPSSRRELRYVVPRRVGARERKVVCARVNISLYRPRRSRPVVYLLLVNKFLIQLKKPMHGREATKLRAVICHIVEIIIPSRIDIFLTSALAPTISGYWWRMTEPGLLRTSGNRRYR